MWCSMLVSPVALAGVHRPQQFQILRDRWSQAPPQVRPELAAAPDCTPRLPCWRTLPSLVGMPLTLAPCILHGFHGAAFYTHC